MLMNIGFRYAEIGKDKKRAYVYFYAIHPENGKLERKRIYINGYKNKQTQERHLKRLVNLINNKLENGWNPFIDDSENKKKYIKIEEALDFVLTYKLRFIKQRSIPQYKQRIRKLKEWLKNYNKLDAYIFEFTDDMAINYMDNLLLNEKIKPRTYNNYLIDYRTFFNLLAKHKYLNHNPFRAIDKLPETEAEKRPFTKEEQKKYVNYVKENDYNMYIMSMLIYYTAIRPAEVCRLKISDININGEFIRVPAGSAKSKKARVVPLSAQMANELKNFISNYPSGYFVCSDNFKPGSTKIWPTRLAERFREIANELGFPQEVKFYGLKDTAAERLINAGFNIKDIRDLFGHENIATTDAYMKRFTMQINPRLKTNFPEF